MGKCSQQTWVHKSQPECEPRGWNDALRGVCWVGKRSNFLRLRGRPPCISSGSSQPFSPSCISLPFRWPLTLHTPNTIDQLFRLYCRRRRPWNFPKNALGAIAFWLDPCRLKDVAFQFFYLKIYSQRLYSFLL